MVMVFNGYSGSGRWPFFGELNQLVDAGLPYPAVAWYDGTGSIDDAANFVAHTPRNPVRNDNRWVGQSLYSHGYQTWPRAVDGKLVLHS